MVDDLRFWYKNKSMAYNILIADDEKEVIELLRLYLEKDGHRVLAAYDGMTALGIVTSTELDCAILDVMMPELNGFQLLKKIREKSRIPVLMLSARGASSDKILGLDLGADDYITKPFDPLEVAARIKSNIRRYKDGSGADDPLQLPSQSLSFGDLKLDTNSCQLKKAGKEIEITSTEYKILKLFMSVPGRVFTKNQLISAGWGEGSPDYVEDNSIMVALSKMRTKIGNEQDGITIKNIRGLGYRLEGKNEQ